MTKAGRKVYIYSYLVSAAAIYSRLSSTQGQDPFNNSMSSILYSAFALEACLNHIGEKVFPHWKQLEKLSPRGKLDVISHEFKFSYDFGSRPFQSFKLAFKFRNQIVHGKTEYADPRKVQSSVDIGGIEYAQPWWETQCKPELAQNVVEDVKKIMEFLNSAIPSVDVIPGILSVGDTVILAEKE